MTVSQLPTFFFFHMERGAPPRAKRLSTFSIEKLFKMKLTLSGIFGPQ